MNKKCIVCGMPADESFTVERDGRKLYFCSSECKSQFMQVTGRGSKEFGEEEING